MWNLKTLHSWVAMLQSMYLKAFHSRCDQWHKEERKESMRRLSYHEGKGRVTLEKKKGKGSM